MPPETRWAMSTTVDHAVQLGGRPPPPVRGLLDGLPAYETACFAVEAARLGDPEQSAALLARWFDGVALLDAITREKSGAARPDGVGGDAEPRVVAAMTHLATAWLSPRFEGEPRTAIRRRIRSLRPVEQNERMGDLFDKRNEGTLATEEKAELYRLGQFFEDLQPILNKAIMSLPPLKS